jgi:hypothetical protein
MPDCHAGSAAVSGCTADGGGTGSVDGANAGTPPGCFHSLPRFTSLGERGASAPWFGGEDGFDGNGFGNSRAPFGEAGVVLSIAVTPP